MKKCFKCGEMKGLDCFYKHPSMPDGTVNKCKECNKADVRKNRLDKLDIYRAYDRKRGSRLTSEYIREYREKNPKKYKAHSMVNNAIRDGRLRKETNCTICNSDVGVSAHHDDYNYPLSIRWLCAACHCAWHKQNGEGANAS